MRGLLQNTPGGCGGGGTFLESTKEKKVPLISPEQKRTPIKGVPNSKCGARAKASGKDFKMFSIRSAPLPVWSWSLRRTLEELKKNNTGMPLGKETNSKAIS